MSTLIFKRLFEVRLLHEFYLADDEQAGQLFYEKTADERRDYLQKIILQGRYDILRDLEIEPTPDTAARMRGRQIKLGRNATGFFVGLEVVADNASSPALFKPRKPLETGFRLSFLIKVRNPGFHARTALRLRRPDALNAFYLWTNAGKTASGSGFPSLSEPAPVFTSGQTYEPGEIVLIGGDLYEAVSRTQNANADNWAITAGQGYTTESDRRALPKQFPWNWTAAPGPATFILNTPAGDEVKRITVNVTENSRRIPLNFSRQVLADGSLGAAIPDGFYRLVVQGGPSDIEAPVFLHGELSGGAPSGSNPFSGSSKLLGLVEIVIGEPGQALPLLDDLGRLLQIPLTGGGSTHPVFEVRFLSRSSWWRYRSDRDLTLQAQNEAVALLDQAGKDLVTKSPRRFFNFPQSISPPASAAPVWLPNPAPEGLRPSPDGRLFAETLISKIPNLIIST